MKKESPPPTPEDLPDELKNKSVRELNLLALSTFFASDEDEEEAEEDNGDQPQGMEGHIEHDLMI